MQKANYTKRAIGIAGLLISILFIIYFSDLIIFLIDFAEKYFSPDNYIDPITVFEIEAIVAVIILLTSTISILLILNLTRNILLFFDNFIQTNELIKFLITDYITSKKRLSLLILIIGTMLGFFLHLYLLKFGQPSSEGIMEKYSSFLFLFSAIILIISMMRINRKLFSSESRKKNITFINGDFRNILTNFR